MVKVFPLRDKIFPHFRQVYPMLSDALEEQSENQPTVKWIDNLKALINMEIYSLSMAILTIYSIFAIDIQKSFFGQHQAYIFGYVHIICIIIFLIDMTFSWVCKEDFKWSFYFWIDVISTSSMIMEITWVDNFLTDNSNLPAVLTIAKVVKASRLSRIGGRAAKIILMFLAYLKAKRKEEEQNLKNQLKNTESVAVESNVNRTATIILETKTRQQDREDEQVQEDNDQVPNELPNKIDLNRMELDPIVEQKITERSEVSDVCFPQKTSRSHSKDSFLQMPFSNLGKRRSKVTRTSDNAALRKKAERAKAFDLTNIVERMIQTFKLQPLKNPTQADSFVQQIQRKWNQICQKEQQARKQSREKIKSNKQNFKLGETLKQRIQKNIIIMIMSLIIILPLISADTWFNKDPSIDQIIGNYLDLANSINDTDTKLLFLKNIIESAQEGTYPVLLLQTADGMKYPGNIMSALSQNPPYQDFMRAEITEVTEDNYYIVFNGRNISQTNAIINIARSCFITILLIFSTIIFMYSIQTTALTPLEKMSVSINKISINPFDALRQMNELDKKEEGEGKSELETNILEQAVKKMTKILALGVGETGSELISNTSESLTSQTGCTLIGGSKLHGVFMCIKITHFEKVCEKWPEDLVTTINKVVNYLHDIVMENGGIIIDNNPPYFVFFWNTPDDLNIERQTTKYFVAGNPLKNLGKTIETQKIIQVVLRSYLQMNIALSEINKKWMDFDNGEENFEPFFLQAGVHIGDAFQGSVGDSLKIEVKCMGEDLKFARSICELAESYHLSNIVSEQVCEIMDDLVEAHLRKVDYVRVKDGEEDKFWLCTYDFSLYPIVGQNQRKDSRLLKKKRKTIRKPEKTFREKKQRSLILKHREDTLLRLKTDPMDVVLPYSSTEKKCLKSYNQKFYVTWNYAIEHYYAGEWDEAIPLLQSINERFDLGYKDAPSEVFLDRIGSGDKQPEDGWENTVLIDLD